MNTYMLAAKNILDEIGSSTLGGEIAQYKMIADPNILLEKVIGSEHVYLHCWNGERYVISIHRLENGCKYDPATSLPIG